jgi:hypothetical protein
MLGSTLLINGGSRFPHVFVAAMFAWSVESLFQIAEPRLLRQGQWAWGAILGISTALMLSARPGDGGMLGAGIVGYFIFAVITKQIGLRAIGGAALTFTLLAGLTLVILRLQLGVWWTTGYSLSAIYYPWNNFAWSVPSPDEVKWGLPLATGAYCWWPCSVPVGLAGIASLRGRARRMGVVFVTAFIPFLTFYILLEVGRGGDRGYGPRYVLPCVVPMAVGTGVMLAKLWERARSREPGRSTLSSGGPLAAGLLAAVVGIVRIAPLVYPHNYADVERHSVLASAIEVAHLQRAIVFAHDGISEVDPMDLPDNLPIDLYPNQDVLIALDRSPELERCVTENFPDRRVYHARMVGSAVRLERARTADR